MQKHQQHRRSIAIGWLLAMLIISSSMIRINYMATAKTLIENDQLEEALELYNQLIKKDHHNTILLNKRAQLLIKLHEPDQALADLKEVLTLDKNNVEGMLGMARYHAYRFHIVPALNYLDKVSDLIDADSRFEYLTTRGEIMMRFKMFSEAEQSLFEAASIRPDDYSLIELFIESLQSQGKDNEIYEYLSLVSNENEMTSQTLTKMGYLMNGIEQYAEANLYLEQALNMDHNNADGLCHLAYTYLKLNKNKEALKKVEKSLHINPLNPYAYRVRGEIYGNLGKPTKACKDFKRALSLDYLADYHDDITELAGSFCGQ